ncbi:MAG: ATP-binding protein [Anaerolineae bacterium]|nr:ATP-binding protein [Anaerolineae bacterium]
MGIFPKKIVEIYLASELGYEKIAIATAAIVADKMGFSADRVEDLKTAVGEAVINAIEHGNQLDDETKVLIVLTAEEQALALNVVDQGTQPIPALPAAGNVPENYPRGWGMFLIKNLMDEVEVWSQPGRNEIKMVIHLGR